MTTSRPTSLMILIAIGVLGLLLLGRPAKPMVNTAQDEDGYDEELLKGKELLRRRNFEDALKSFKRANEMRGKKSAECYNLMC